MVVRLQSSITFLVAYMKTVDIQKEKLRSKGKTW